jgi:large subunit ribosomal protein L3
MIKAFLGRKIGMTQIFNDAGHVQPVTIIEAGPCAVTQIRTAQRDGYESVQLGFGRVRRPNKPEAGHLGGSQIGRRLQEVAADDIDEYEVGQLVTVGIFEPGEIVDIIGKSKGKGFAGTMKRHGFHGGPRTHGQSDRQRAPGSIGGGTTPGRVFKGLKMAGHMGNRRVTSKGLEVVQVDPERNLLMVKGGIPGGPNSPVTIRKTGKRKA